ncbi:hypothetical protein [Megamonas funiformis]|uniref:hypothetical protein n=1 Tax=Megamonas funiformis TaxID=437897 RepID=UPI0022E020E9|nr:hypothetical protein [Megamonas funiformis]
MANKKSKLSRLENQILEARVYVKRGLYESFYVQDGSVYLIPCPNRRLYEDKVCFYCAKIEYQRQTYINKLNQKFIKKIYKLALLIKNHINDEYDYDFEDYAFKHFSYIIAELLDFIEENYFDGSNCLPVTLSVMYDLAKFIRGEQKNV